MTHVKRTIHCILALLIAAAAWGAGTPAGTVIRNQASAQANGETYLSNEVDTTVRTVCAPNLTPNGTPAAPGQSVSVGAGARAYLPYTLTNAGNDRFTFDLSVAQGAGGWTPSETALYEDVNRNGRLDAGETAVSSLTLERGADAALILEVATPSDAAGDKTLSPAATCQGTAEEDAENYGLVQIVQGSALQLFKTVSSPTLSPGDTARFEVRLLNDGSQPSIGPVLTDDFDLANLDGLTFVAGSAAATQGTVEYSDGSTWTQNEPAAVRGVRLRLDSLAVGGAAFLRFDLRVTFGAAAGARQNRAFATGPGGPAEASAEFDVTRDNLHFLGPGGNPRANPGGEGSADDTQTGRLVYAQASCFTHTLENASTARDRYEVSFSGLPAGVTGTLRSVGGEPLPRTLELRAGERRNFQFCVTANDLVQPFTVTLTATSQTGRTNLTYDRVDEVVAAGPELDLVKRAEPEGSVGEGELLTYTLSVTNDHDFDLNDVRVSDTLQGFENVDGGSALGVPAPTFVSASDGGTYDADTRTVTWRVSQLGAGESVTFTLGVKMPEDVPDSARFVLRNRFRVAAQELPEPKASNEVTHAFPLLSLNIEKTVEEEVVRIGDTLHYTVTVSNPNDVALELTLIDTPPERTAYVAGSAVVKSGANESATEPQARGDELVWDLTNEPDFLLEPKGSADGRDRVSVSYALSVQPGASSPLRNTAYARGTFGDGAVSGVVVVSDEVQVDVALDERVLGRPDALLSGRVYLDVNQNCAYERGLDVPLPGARVLLPNGWQTLTDAEGRYTFRDLTPGAWSVTLDAASAPFAPLPHPEGLREGYQHRAVLQGLTVSDFPLVAPAGTIRAYRQTTLRFGPLSVEKRLIALPQPDGGEGVRVVLTLSSPEPLPELVVSDPVPGAAPRRFTFEAFEGEQTLTYDLNAPIGLTDPDARWRYP